MKYVGFWLIKFENLPLKEMSLQNILHCISKNGAWFKIAFSSLEIQNEFNFPMKKNTQKKSGKRKYAFFEKDYLHFLRGKGLWFGRQSKDPFFSKNVNFFILFYTLSRKNVSQVTDFFFKNMVYNRTSLSCQKVLLAFWLKNNLVTRVIV